MLAVAQIDDAELLALIDYQDVKDLDNFGMQKRLFRLREKYKNLIKDDAIVAYNALGIIESFNNNYMEAIASFKKAYKLSPQSITITINYALSCDFELTYHELAMSLFNDLLDKYPNNEEVFHEVALFANRKLDLNLLQKLEKINPEKLAVFVPQRVRALCMLLQKEQFDLTIYRILFVFVQQAVNKYLVITRMLESVHYDSEHERLVVNIAFHASVDVVHQIEQEYERLVYDYACKQSDGGFDFFNRALRCVMLFDVKYGAMQDVV